MLYPRVGGGRHWVRSRQSSWWLRDRSTVLERWCRGVGPSERDKLVKGDGEEGVN